MTFAAAEDRTSDVRDAFAALARSIKRIGVYRHAREKRGDFLQPASTAILRLLEGDPTLTLQVEPSALLFQGQVVYSEPAREGSLFFRLHRDGVRTITFRRGLSLAELITFVDVALPDEQGGQGPGREDAVTELWKADLRHIGYTAASGYRAEDEHDAQEDVPDAVLEAARRAQRALDAYAAQFTPSDELEAREAPALLSPDERDVLDPPAWGPLAMRVVETIFELVGRGYGGRDLDSLAEAFGRIVDEMLNRGEESALTFAVSRPPAMAGRQADAFWVSLGARFADPARLGRVLELARVNPRLAEEVLQPWLALLPQEAGPTLIDVLDVEPAARLRTVLAQAAARRLDSSRLFYEERMRRGKPDVVVVLLAALRGVASTDAAAVAVQALGHEDLAVRLEAIELVAADPRLALQKLGPLLEDEEGEIRRHAATALGTCKAVKEEAARLLLAGIGRSDFTRFERSVQTECYRALGRLESTAGHTFLARRLAEPQRSLFARKRGEEDQLLAVMGLAAEPSERSLAVLEKAGDPARGLSAPVAAASRSGAHQVRAALARGSGRPENP